MKLKIIKEFFLNFKHKFADLLVFAIFNIKFKQLSLITFNKKISMCYNKN